MLQPVCPTGARKVSAQIVKRSMRLTIPLAHLEIDARNRSDILNAFCIEDCILGGAADPAAFEWNADPVPPGRSASSFILLFVRKLEQAMDAQWNRIESIVGDGETTTFEDQVDKFYDHLLRSLELPCDVTGTEDFRWEERYVVGGASRAEYQRLRKERPSYQDKYDLLAIEKGVFSEWMLFQGDDIGAHVKRKSDGREFWLGLAELKGVEKKSRNAQLLHDFAVFFVNSR